ncbi:MAG: beta-ketoacyl-[acyl-carrier-protein] synthase family protein [Desulfobacterales bacterium]|nr:beta-ketoacyl-[acyl-carrier-protein] synthase family protein [Desulfobacterales bacterium]
MKAKVGITGLGAVSAAGNCVQENMDSMLSGLRNPHPPTLFKVDMNSPFPVFEVETELPVIENRTITRSNRLLLCAVHEALAQASLDTEKLQNARTGICLGTTVACTLNNEPYYRAYRNNEMPGFSSIDVYLNNNPSLFLSAHLGTTGPVSTIANACSSATDAIGSAMWWLKNDLCDVVITGGTDELCRTTYLGFSSLMVMSPEPCRPFDADRTGLNLGEGAGILILERENFSKTRGVKILSEISGYGTCSDAYHMTAPHPGGMGLRRAIDTAFKNSDLTPSDISFINAHGTATKNNDQVEGSVLHDLFESVPVVSTKAYTGHTLGAAGGLEAVFTTISLMSGKIPGTAGFETADPECALKPTKTSLSVHKKAAISTSLAFGGTNSALLFRGSA